MTPGMSADRHPRMTALPPVGVGVGVGTGPAADGS